MASSLARDARILTASTKIRYLKSTKDGFPIDKQIPRTIQSYLGAGGVGVTLDYDGSNDVVIFTLNLTGDLIIRFCPSAINDKYNLLGRETKIHINGPTTRSITLSSSPAFMKINATTLTQLSHIIPGDNLSKTITISFNTIDLWNVDYGSSVASIVPPASSMAPKPKYYRNTYMVSYTDSLSNLVSNGTPPYTATGLSGYTSPLDPRLGILSIDNTLATFNYYPPQGEVETRVVPISITDSTGANVTSQLIVSPDKTAIVGSAAIGTPICTCIGTSGGVQGIYTNTSVASFLLVSDTTDITTFTVNQDSCMVYYTTVSGGTAITYFDPIRNNKGTFSTITPTFATVGITAVRCMGFSHETQELYVFGNTVLQPVYVIKPRKYNRSQTAPIHSVETVTILTNALDPTNQPVLAAIYGNTSYVIGCEFIDKRDMVVISLYDPAVNQTKIVTLNGSMFKNRGTDATGVGDQYVIGVYSPSGGGTLNIRMPVYSYVISDYFCLCILNSGGTLGFARPQKDLSWFNNTLLTDNQIISFSVTITIPTEVRCSRNLIGF